MSFNRSHVIPIHLFNKPFRDLSCFVWLHSLHIFIHVLFIALTHLFIVSGEGQIHLTPTEKGIPVVYSSFLYFKMEAYLDYNCVSM